MLAKASPPSRTLEDRRPRAALQPTKGFHEFFCLDFRGVQAASLHSPMWNPLRARMKFPMDRFQALLINVRVNLSRRDVGVAEHLLDDAQIRAVA